jgi:hypothetical protein
LEIQEKIQTYFPGLVSVGDFGLHGLIVFNRFLFGKPNSEQPIRGWFIKNEQFQGLPRYQAMSSRSG